MTLLAATAKLFLKCGVGYVVALGTNFLYKSMTKPENWPEWLTFDPWFGQCVMHRPNLDKIVPDNYVIAAYNDFYNGEAVRMAKRVAPDVGFNDVYDDDGTVVAVAKGKTLQVVRDAKPHTMLWLDPNFRVDGFVLCDKLSGFTERHEASLGYDATRLHYTIRQFIWRKTFPLLQPLAFTDNYFRWKHAEEYGRFMADKK